METFGFILGSAALSFGLIALAQVQALKEEVAELKRSLGRSRAPGPGDSEKTNN